MIYLDTHVVVWLYQKDLLRFSSSLLRHIEEASLLISPMVPLELQYLCETGRIREGAEPIIRYLRNAVGLSLCALPFEEVVMVAIDQQWTRDPFDRIIVAQAMVQKRPLVTKDDTIRAYYDHAIW